MSDPRMGRVSASRFEILALCPGSESLRRSLPADALDTADEYSESGTRLHRAWETNNTFELVGAEIEIYRSGLITLEKIIEQWQQDFNLEQSAEGERELRLYLHDDNLTPVASGQMDRHYVSPGQSPHVLVCDFKGLYAPNLTPAERNWQGRTLAVLAAEEYNACHVRVAFNKAMYGKADQVDYDEDALRNARNSILQAVWESEQEGAQFRPGRHCVHCPGKAYCDEAVGYAQLPRVTTGDGDPLERVKVLPLGVLVPVWRKWSLVAKIFAAIIERLNKLTDEELAELGLRRKDGKKLDKIKDVAGVVEYLRAAGWSDTEIFSAVSISKSGLIEQHMTRTNCREKEAETWFDTALDQFIERKRGNKILEEVQ